ncbi:putative RNA interference and gene silencing protein [Phyllosticta capitalensis]
MSTRGGRGGGNPRGRGRGGSDRGMSSGGARGGYGGRGGGGPAGRGGGGGGPAQFFQVYTDPTNTNPRPAEQVTKTEDAIQKSVTGTQSLSKLSLNDGTPPVRPGYGTRGTPVILWANFFELITKKDVPVYRYDILVAPEEKGKKHEQLVKLFLAELKLASTGIVTDFKSTLILPEKLERDDITLDIMYRAEGQDEPLPNARQYKVRAKYIQTHSFAEVVNFATSSDMGTQFPDQGPSIQALNIFFNHHAKSTDGLTAVGRKAFSIGPGAQRLDLGHGLYAMRGFYSSVRMATCRILVNVNVSYAAFFQDIPLENLMQKHGVENKYRLEKFLKKLKIRTTHLPEKRNKSGQIVPRVKTISAFANKFDGRQLAHPPKVKAHGAGPKDVEFWMDSTPQTSQGSKKGAKGKENEKAASGGRYISVYDFFVQTYNRRIKDPSLPVVNVGTIDNPSYLPAEVGIVMPGQPSKSKLDPDQTQRMITAAVRRPYENAALIVNEGHQTVGLTQEENPQLARFGIEVLKKLITVQGRVLKEPKIIYRKDQSVLPRTGSWNITEVKLHTPGIPVQKWSWLLISNSRKDTPTDTEMPDLMARFHKTLVASGVNIAPPIRGNRLVMQTPDKPELDNMFARASTALDLLFIVIASPGKHPVYNRIKTLGDVKYGLPTICADGTKFSKVNGQDQYFRNVALKFNLKRSGINHKVDISDLDMDKTMIVGIDVTHPSPDSRSTAPSIAAMVASVDKHLGQWPAKLSIQSSARQEMVSSLGEMLKTRLRLWKTKGNHSAFPENIIVYRDGVSEGQYQMCTNQEMPQLREACKELYPAPDTKRGLPRFTFIVVGKRHHTRFYPTSSQNAEKNGNNKPGTVVDRGVTNAREWDFYLQAHAAIQGTARPAHYIVLLDEIFRTKYSKAPLPPDCKNVSDVLEKMTQQLCYVFARATKAVSYCPPAYYADIACERARCYLSDLFESSSAGSNVEGQGAGAREDDIKVHDKLKDTMFYM